MGKRGWPLDHSAPVPRRHGAPLTWGFPSYDLNNEPRSMFFHKLCMTLWIVQRWIQRQSCGGDRWFGHLSGAG